MSYKMWPVPSIRAYLPLTLLLGGLDDVSGMKMWDLDYQSVKNPRWELESGIGRVGLNRRASYESINDAFLRLNEITAIWCFWAPLSSYQALIFSGERLPSLIDQIGTLNWNNKLKQHDTSSNHPLDNRYSQHALPCRSPRINPPTGRRRPKAELIEVATKQCPAGSILR
jgi:hypothetical protein